MKTNTLSTQNTCLYSVAVFFSFLLSSCGSYQNSSYYDSDGIYGTTPNTSTQRENRSPQYNDNHYKSYFESLQKENQTQEIFTNIEEYSNYNLQNDYQPNKNYAGWGNNTQTVNINVYDTGWPINTWYTNRYYGNNWYGNHYGWYGAYDWRMNAGFGWNTFYGNNWYGNNWYGNNWYGNNWNYGTYYSNRARSYNVGGRGSNYNNAGNYRNSGTSSNRVQSNSSNRRATNAEYTPDTDYQRNFPERRNTTTNPPIYRNPTQPQNNTPSNDQSAPRRGNINNGRNENNAPTRSYTPATTRNYDNSRSYSPSTPNSSSNSRSYGGESSSSGRRR